MGYSITTTNGTKYIVIFGETTASTTIIIEPMESLKEKPDFKPLPEIKLYDRADGVKGHFCVGQDRDGITEYWTGREFSGFGRLYTSEQEAIDMRDLLVLYRDHRNRAHDLQKELILAKEEIERLKEHIQILKLSQEGKVDSPF